MTLRRKFDILVAVACVGMAITYANAWIDGWMCTLLISCGIVLIINPGPPHNREGKLE